MSAFSPWKLLRDPVISSHNHYKKNAKEFAYDRHLIAKDHIIELCLAPDEYRLGHVVTALEQCY